MVGRMFRMRWSERMVGMRWLERMVGMRWSDGKNGWDEMGLERMVGM
jgi:hypothetical protein